MGSYVGRGEADVVADNVDEENGTVDGPVTNDVGGTVGGQSGSEVK